MCIRIQLSHSTVKDLQRRLQQAYQKDDVRLVRRTTVLLDLLVHHVPVEVLCERWGLMAPRLHTARGRQPRLPPWWWPAHEADPTAKETADRSPGGRSASRGL